MFIRLDRALASQGTKSRSEVKKLIKSGRVTVNGAVIKTAEMKVDTEKDRVCINGEALNIKEHIYIMMNKPAGVVSATKDNTDKTVIDILPDNLKRKGLFPVGRLDKDTEGLLIITDDGDFAHRVLSPAKKVYKVYIAVLDGNINESDIKAFKDGIVFADGTKCKSAELEIISNKKPYTARVEICEGKFHQVKKMFKICGKNVLKLQRISIGNLTLDEKLHKGQAKKMDILDINNIFIGKVY